MFLWIDIDRRWLALLVALTAHAACQAGARERIFLIEDDPAAIHLSDRADGHAARLLLEEATSVEALPAAASRIAPARAAATQSDIADIADIVRHAAQANALDPNLLHAVIAAESGYAGRAVSPRGAQGLMQLMPATARGYGVTDPFDARQNVRAGALHLRRLLDQFDQDTVLALAAYNAGAAAVRRHGRGVPPFAETMAYVPRVLRHLAARPPSP